MLFTINVTLDEVEADQKLQGPVVFEIGCLRE